MITHSARKGIAVLLTATFLIAAWFFFFSSDTEADPIQKQYELLTTPMAKKLYFEQSDGLTQPVPSRLVELDQKVIGCFGPDQILAMSPDEDSLGGQCCGALRDMNAYQAQLDALSDFIEKNGNIEFIPHDPYDVSVRQAQQLLVFDRDIHLTSDQQRTFDLATEMSHHGGPCCCKCWKWFMMSGLGKKMIADYDWNEHQLAELWDTSSSCGHAEDTSMYEHYQHESMEMLS